MGRTSNARQRLMDALSELIWTGSYGATTIDQICERAGVKKGSFYHFFKSKSDLACAALEDGFQQRRADMDATFSPLVPPLERLMEYCRKGLEEQRFMKAKYGFVLGCPLFTLGAEVSTQESRLRAAIQDILDKHLHYLTSAIRDAHAEGLIDAPDAASKARVVEAYLEGMLTQARIQNDLEPLMEMPAGILSILGARPTPATPPAAGPQGKTPSVSPF